MVAEGLPAQLACRVLEVSESGFYAWRIRAPSLRALRHAWLTEMISRIHVDFRGVYGYRRVHAELTLGHGITVGTEAVWLLMRKAGLQGISGRPRYRRIPNHQPTAVDLAERPSPEPRAPQSLHGTRGDSLETTCRAHRSYDHPQLRALSQPSGQFVRREVHERDAASAGVARAGGGLG